MKRSAEASHGDVFGTLQSTIRRKSEGKYVYLTETRFEFMLFCFCFRKCSQMPSICVYIHKYTQLRIRMHNIVNTFILFDRP